MPDSKFTSWVHGSSMQIEYPNRVTSVRHTGPFVRIEGADHQVMIDQPARFQAAVERFLG